MNCINCGTPVDSNFCSNCGQKANTKRLNFASLWMDFQSRIYGFDGIFPRTVKDLAIRPGKVIDGFIKGVRVSYVGPSGYFFLIVAISVLLMEVTNLDYYEFSKTSTPGLTVETNKQAAISKMLTEFVYNNFRIFKFCLIPLNAFWIWLFIRKKGYNYLESSVSAFYAQGQLELFLIINLVLLYCFQWHMYKLVFLVEPCYYGFMLTTWFPENKFKLFLKGIIVWLASFATYVMLITIGILIWLIKHPDFLEKIKG